MLITGCIQDTKSGKYVCIYISSERQQCRAAALAVSLKISFWDLECLRSPTQLDIMASSFLAHFMRALNAKIKRAHKRLGANGEMADGSANTTSARVQMWPPTMAYCCPSVGERVDLFAFTFACLTEAPDNNPVTY